MLDAGETVVRSGLSAGVEPRKIADRTYHAMDAARVPPARGVSEDVRSAILQDLEAGMSGRACRIRHGVGGSTISRITEQWRASRGETT